MSYSFPSTLAEAAMLAEREPHSAYIAGGTDLMVRRSLNLDSAGHLIDLSGIEELRGIVLTGNTLTIGGATTLAELAADPSVQSFFPALSQAALSIASPPVRNSATVAGNLLCENRCVYYDQSEFWQTAAGGCLKCGAEVCIATGSAKHCYSVFISDLAPVLIALGSRVEVFDHARVEGAVPGTRPYPEKSGAGRIVDDAGTCHALSVEELYTGDGLNPLTISKKDILTRIVLQIPSKEASSTMQRSIFFRKLRPRASVDFTNLTVAIGCTPSGSLILAASGIGPAPAVLSAMMGRSPKPEDINALVAGLLKQSQIIDNLSYLRSYRKEMLYETVKQGIAMFFPEQ